MSRSKPQGTDPNPAVRWFEWHGEQGVVRHYDKTAKQNIIEPLPFRFLLLDEVGTVRGWHDTSNSGIYANQVRDTRSDVLVVKAFKGGTLAEGLYKDIKDRVNTLGGRFNADCYIAFKLDGALALGVLRFKGAALGAWMEFRKAHRADLYEKAIEIDGYTEGKKGRIVFRTPTFRLVSVSADTQQIAVAIDADLQRWLDGYFSKRTAEQPHADDVANEPEPDDDGRMAAPDEDDIPF